MKYAIISDIHSNIPAFQAVAKDIEKRGIELVLCAGDVVGYGPHPNEAVEMLREMGIECVMGNHDFHINLKNLEWFNYDARISLIWTSKKLNKRNKRFLSKLPNTLLKRI